MKNLILILTLFLGFIYSCTKEEIQTNVKPITKDTIKTYVNDLKFKLYPTANDQFTISVQNFDSKNYTLYLKKDNKEVANYLLAPVNANTSITSAIVQYNFSPNDVYQILIRGTKENQDSVFQEDFIINNYSHKYYNKFKYEKLASITQTLDFDISPSRNVIYYIDYISNKFVLKRLKIADRKLDVLDENFNSLLIRSKSDDQLIISTRNYNNRYLGADSCALLSYDVNTHLSSFIDWGSSDYGRYSRVVNNSIMVSNPINTGSISLINLSDNSKNVIQANIVFLSETSFDHLYWNRNILNFSNLNFENPLPFLNSSSSIAYYDEISHYYITVEHFWESASTVYTRMVIYKDNKIVYEQPFEKGRGFGFPSIISLEDNKLIFYQSYEYDSVVRFDGYYLLDISTKQLTLLQNDNNNYIKYDFFDNGNKGSFISVRPYDIYKITIN